MTVTSRAFDAALQEATADRVSADAKFGTNIRVGSPSQMLGDDVINVQSHRFARWRLRSVAVAALAVFGLRHQLEILYGVIQRIAVNVMDNLPAGKRPSQMTLHDDSMLIALPAINVNLTVAERFVDVAAFVMGGLWAKLPQPGLRGALRSCHTHIVARYGFTNKKEKAYGS